MQIPLSQTGYNYTAQSPLFSYLLKHPQHGSAPWKSNPVPKGRFQRKNGAQTQVDRRPRNSVLLNHFLHRLLFAHPGPPQLQTTENIERTQKKHKISTIAQSQPSLFCQSLIIAAVISSQVLGCVVVITPELFQGRSRDK